MRNLIKRPASPAAGFWQGAFCVGIPLGIGLPLRAFVRFGPLSWKDAAVLACIVGSATLMAGLLFALWRLVQNLAYDRFIQGPRF